MVLKYGILSKSKFTKMSRSIILSHVEFIGDSCVYKMNSSYGLG